MPFWFQTSQEGGVHIKIFKCFPKLKRKAGFTLVEALIVLAILGVLAAVAIPAYNIQLENSRIKVDDAALATAGSMAVSDYLLRTGGTTYSDYVYLGYQRQVGNNTLIKVVVHSPATEFDPQDIVGWGPCLPTSKQYAGKTMMIAVKDGVLTVCRWGGSAPTPP